MKEIEKIVTKRTIWRCDNVNCSHYVYWKSDLISVQGKELCSLCFKNLRNKLQEKCKNHKWSYETKVDSSTNVVSILEICEICRLTHSKVIKEIESEMIWKILP